MLQLEAEGLLDREIESLPSAEQMAERQRPGAAMARPELCVLLAYAKRSLEEAIRSSALPDDPYLERDLRGYFPAPVDRAVRPRPHAAPAASRAGVDDHRERGRQRPGHHVRLPARRRNGPEPRRSRAPTASPATSTGAGEPLGRRRSARRQDRPRAAERPDGRRRHARRRRLALVSAQRARRTPRRDDRGSQATVPGPRGRDRAGSAPRAGGSSRGGSSADCRRGRRARGDRAAPRFSAGARTRAGYRGGRAGDGPHHRGGSDARSSSPASASTSTGSSSELVELPDDDELAALGSAGGRRTT